MLFAVVASKESRLAVSRFAYSFFSPLKVRTLRFLYWSCVLKVTVYKSSSVQFS